MIRFDHVPSATRTAPSPSTTSSLDAPSGEITVLVGPSGCGKTTSLRMINRMIEPTVGHGSGSTTATPPRSRRPQLRRGIGYVIQHAGLFPHRTIVDNVATVPLLLGADKKQARARAHGAARAGRPRPGASPSAIPAQLSGGQQQRVGVARALAADPPVMLMDEPFSAVDPVVREQLQDEFLRLQDELGKTIVFVTHDIDEAIKLGDQVAVLRVGGKLAQLRHAGRAARPGRPTRSSPASSAATAATARSASPTPATCRSPTSRRSRWARAAAPPQGATTAGCSWSTTTARPQGWCRRRSRRRARGTVTEEPADRGGTLATAGRHAARRPGRLPVLAVAVAGSSSTSDGRLLGTITARRGRST